MIQLLGWPNDAEKDIPFGMFTHYEPKTTALQTCDQRKEGLFFTLTVGRAGSFVLQGATFQGVPDSAEWGSKSLSKSTKGGATSVRPRYWESV